MKNLSVLETYDDLCLDDERTPVFRATIQALGPDAEFLKRLTELIEAPDSSEERLRCVKKIADIRVDKLASCHCEHCQDQAASVRNKIIKAMRTES